MTHFAPVIAENSARTKCEGHDDPEERCPRHPNDCICWQGRNPSPAENFTAAKIWNVAADDENGHSQIMCVDWMPRADAEQFAVHYTENYVGKPYPNGKGHYSITNIRLVREVSTDE